MAPALEPKAARPQERRSYQRYPVRLGLRYKLFRNSDLPQEGCGTTLDLSAGGLFVCADQALPEGVQVELSMDWPVKSERCSFLRLHIAGRIVRSTEAGCAVQIGTSHFRPVAATATG